MFNRRKREGHSSLSSNEEPNLPTSLSKNS
jgi:hypothetical protein